MAEPLPKPVAKALERLSQAPDPLSRLATIRTTQDALEQMARAAADEARAAGATWKQIGAIYGTSKQAAQQRFRRRPPAEPPPDGPGSAAEDDAAPSPPP